MRQMLDEEMSAFAARAVECPVKVRQKSIALRHGTRASRVCRGSRRRERRSVREGILVTSSQSLAGVKMETDVGVVCEVDAE